MEKKETKLVEALRKDYKELYVKEYTTGWREQRLLRNIELGIMSLRNTEKYISQELSKAREEGFTRDELRVLQILLEESNDWQEEKIFTLFDGDITTEVLEKIKSKLKNNK